MVARVSGVWFDVASGRSSKFFLQGEIKKVGDHKYEVNGVAKKINNTTVEISELPIGKWTQPYKAELEAMIEASDSGVKVRKTHGITLRANSDTPLRTTRNTTPQRMFSSA